MCAAREGPFVAVQKFENTLTSKFGASGTGCCNVRPTNFRPAKIHPATGNLNVDNFRIAGLVESSPAAGRGVWLKQRVRHPKINECRDRGTPYWFFRYWADELAPDRTIKTSRKRRIVGPGKGTDAITKKQAEIARDQFLANLNAAPSPCQAAVQAIEPADIGAILEDSHPLGTLVDAIASGSPA